MVPDAGHKQVLEELHEVHPRITQMKQIARTLVWWFGIDKDIEKTVNTCVECPTTTTISSFTAMDLAFKTLESPTC